MHTYTLARTTLSSELCKLQHTRSAVAGVTSTSQRSITHTYTLPRARIHIFQVPETKLTCNFRFHSRPQTQVDIHVQHCTVNRWGVSNGVFSLLREIFARATNYLRSGRVIRRINGTRRARTSEVLFTRTQSRKKRSQRHLLQSNT